MFRLAVPAFSAGSPDPKWLTRPESTHNPLLRRRKRRLGASYEEHEATASVKEMSSSLQAFAQNQNQVGLTSENGPLSGIRVMICAFSADRNCVVSVGVKTGSPMEPP